ncbi:expressed unknown protein [Ectocarpus siliculosus]|uniref:Uncharacterized protein n=1 Tax=Ectocarpus siliculosus TaxID=2880 RepID=D8LJK4_ECTSI|nr:expressed unknown protein [Ectocarpus siliculosus]|eukprot:CBN77031.1 expressed unknown protein [Ectocarpus siliculosus]
MLFSSHHSEYKVLEGVLVLLIGVLSTFWLPLPLYRLREAVTCRRRRLRLLRQSEESGGKVDVGADSKAIRPVGGRGAGNGGVDGQTTEGAAESLTGQDPKSAAAASDGFPDLGRRYLDFLAQALGQSHSAAAAAIAAPDRRTGLPRNGGGHPEGCFVDVSAYDEVVLTTEWEADGLLAACLLFSVVTAETKRAPFASDGTKRPYPLRTLIVGEGKASQAREALEAMRRTKLVPPDCRVDVLEPGEGAAKGEKRREDRGIEEEEEEEEEGEEEGGGGDGVWRSFLGSCSMLLLLLRSTLRWLSGRRRGLARGQGEGGEGSGSGHSLRRQWHRRPSAGGDEELSREDVEEALARVNRVLVVQLEDLVRPYGFPRAIAPDRTPTLAAAVAGARGVLPSCLRREIAASNHLALTEFPDKVASAIKAGRYANEELRVTASSIAAAAVAEEPGMGRGRVAELGACMADLIASDFEALEMAGLSPGTQQAVFRSLDVGMALSDVAAAWALVRQDAVCWESCPRVGLDHSAGRLISLGDGARGEETGENSSGRRGGSSSSGDSIEGSAGRAGGDDGDIVEDGGDPRRRTRGKKGDARGGKGEQQQRGQEEEKIVVRRTGDGLCGSCVGGFLATGFADGFEKLEDQEAGYGAFAVFIVRVLDQMP